MSSTFRRLLRLENRRSILRPGRLEHITDFTSTHLGGPRLVTVYLPAGYDTKTDRRYPVLYMHDAQNLFDAERAYIPGQHWRLSEAADAAIGERTASPMIIVGIDHGGTKRIDEYTPTRVAKHEGSGGASEHARMLFEELKPMIDARYRTIAEDTGVGGSSLGGLVSMWLALQHADRVQRALVMSPSVWWDDRVLLREANAFQGPSRPRIWLDVGGREGLDTLRDARDLAARLRAKGWNATNLNFFEDRRGDHSERAWARRVRSALEFLYPPS